MSGKAKLKAGRRAKCNIELGPSFE